MHHPQWCHTILYSFYFKYLNESDPIMLVTKETMCKGRSPSPHWLLGFLNKGAMQFKHRVIWKRLSVFCCEFTNVLTEPWMKQSLTVKAADVLLTGRRSGKKQNAMAECRVCASVCLHFYGTGITVCTRSWQYPSLTDWTKSARCIPS